MVGQKEMTWVAAVVGLYYFVDGIHVKFSNMNS